MIKRPQKTEMDHIKNARACLLNAILAYVPSYGWGKVAFDYACCDVSLPADLIKQACPRGAIDLAVALHKHDDQRMVEAFSDQLDNRLKVREKIIHAVRLRLNFARSNKEAIRCACSLFSLPHNFAEGSSLLWQTCDEIWVIAGDTSTDINWYSKRVTLYGVYSATLLFWLGDTSSDHVQTWAFLDRRIEEVMRIEKTKACVKNTRIGQNIAALFSSIQKPDNNKDSFTKEYT